MRRLKKFLISLVPIRLIRRIKTGISSPCGPFQSIAKRHDGMTAPTFMLLLSTESLEICKVCMKEIIHAFAHVLLTAIVIILICTIHNCIAASQFRKCYIILSICTRVKSFSVKNHCM